MGEKRLVRSKRDRMFLGVLGGLAEYLNVDPTLVRLVFVILLVFNPVTMVILYLLAAIVVPEEGENEKPVEERLNDIMREAEKVVSGEEGSEIIKIVAIVLILIGAMYLAVFALPALFIFRTPVGTNLLAILLILLGIILLFRGD
ncbi:transcriptional regulator [Thermococcus profundus]|uniref:Transcriptional regulator n=1 Tax=Thermococcus profundus TaxID=49899 RepID=A0A2Z2ML09_THEPR|nr:PspC domain-containing protein [Thermococcus profundus]ASJ02648.1 transcriptional regulator [Thermococcus profundus]